MTNRTIGQLVVGFMMVFLFTLPSPAGVVRQITDLVQTETTAGVLDDSGSVVFVASNSDPYGGNPDRYYQLFRYDTATGEGEQITSLTYGISKTWDTTIHSVTDDGSRVVFLSYSDPTGGNPDGSLELFLVDADGSNLIQLTSITTTGFEGIWDYAISGNGNRVVFTSNSDLVGSNPDHDDQVYIVDADGTDLRQLTSFFSYIPSISDDGDRIAFCSRETTGTGELQIFRINADGSDLLQLTAFDRTNSAYPRISGDGSTIAFWADAPIGAPFCGCDLHQIGIVNWDGSGLQCVVSPCAGAIVGSYAGPPDITDDGETIFYTSLDHDSLGGGSYNWEVRRVERDRTGQWQLTDTGSGPEPIADCTLARVSGDGSTITFWCEGGDPFGDSNDDFSGEVYVGSGTGTGSPTDHLQLTDTLSGDSYQPDLTPDGSRIVFVSGADPLDEPGNNLPQLYLAAPDGSGITRVTSFDHGTTKEPSITDAGDWIVFSHDGDPLGTNAYGGYQIFAIRDDGTSLRQLTPQNENSIQPTDLPQVNGNGTMAVFQSQVNVLEESLASSQTVYRVLLDGTGLIRLSENVSGAANHPRVDNTGQFAVYAHSSTVYRILTDGTGRQALSGAGYADWPDISSDGTRVVYQVASDTTMTDAQLYLWEQSTGASRPLTATATGSNQLPTISGDGAWVYFWSDAPYFGVDSLDFLMRYRLEVTSGTVERVEGLICGHWTEYSYPMLSTSVSEDGRLAAFSTHNNCAGNNRDFTEEVFVIDHDEPARIMVSPGPAPTTLSWDAEPRGFRYDIVRSDVAALATNGSGGIDLGTVLCLEDESRDNSTSGYDDPDTPVSGQVLFYLYRSSPGVADPGSYGTSSAGEERLPSAGDCE